MNSYKEKIPRFIMMK